MSRRPKRDRRDLESDLPTNANGVTIAPNATPENYGVTIREVMSWLGSRDGVPYDVRGYVRTPITASIAAAFLERRNDELGS